MMNLVTGGTGFIGSHLVDTLVSKGEDVRVLVRKTSNKKYLAGKDVEFVYGNLEDMDSLKAVVENVNVIYHLAGMLGKGINSRYEYEKLRRINVRGTENLLKACLAEDIHRFVHFSSTAAIGHTESIADETTDCNPMDPYGQSKYESEKVAFKFFNDYKIPVAIVRPSMVYGPRETTNKAKFFQSIQKGAFRIIGNGQNLMSFVYVDDIVQGCILAAEKKKTIGEIYILSSKKAYTMNEVVQAIAKEMGVKIPKFHIPISVAKAVGFSFEILGKMFGFSPPLSRGRVITLTSNHVYNISKAENDLCYTPRIDLKEGVQLTIKWYFENNILSKK